ncbi:hypothetical protein TREES_T100007272 [Tupaia chinensis]|uniref:Uncharacterized protein n=1 Tax=Tupaia chinensis TaxID=246437 RepID=L9L0T2_TUPCH|nr:hypothetical protein TREES_T100007272 [Tupaia chinensis]
MTVPGTRSVTSVPRHRSNGQGPSRRLEATSDPNPSPPAAAFSSLLSSSGSAPLGCKGPCPWPCSALHCEGHREAPAFGGNVMTEEPLGHLGADSQGALQIQSLGPGCVQGDACMEKDVRKGLIYEELTVQQRADDLPTDGPSQGASQGQKYGVPSQGPDSACRRQIPVLRADWPPPDTFLTRPVPVPPHSVGQDAGRLAPGCAQNTTGTRATVTGPKELHGTRAGEATGCGQGRYPLHASFCWVGTTELLTGPPSHVMIPREHEGKGQHRTEPAAGPREVIRSLRLAIAGSRTKAKALSACRAGALSAQHRLPARAEYRLCIKATKGVVGPGECKEELPVHYPRIPGEDV